MGNYPSTFAHLGQIYFNIGNTAIPKSLIPASLKAIFPNQPFYYKKGRSGIYLLFFKRAVSFIFEKAKISPFVFRVTSFSPATRPNLNRPRKKMAVRPLHLLYFKAPLLVDRDKCIKIEKWLVKSCPVPTLNLKKNLLLNSSSNLSSSGKDPKVYTKKLVEFKLITGSLKSFGLLFVGIKPPKGEGCVYLLINAEKKTFYVGQSRDFLSSALRRHKNNLKQYLLEKQAGPVR